MWPLLFDSSGFAIPTYIVVNSLVFSLGIVWIFYRAVARKFDPNAVLDISLVAMIGCFVGARGAHILIEHPEFYSKHPEMIYKFWYGGFVYYGGAVGGFIGAAAVCWRKKLDFLRHADLFSPVLAAGYALGRLGCLAAGCCFGRPTDLPWAIYFGQGVEAPAGVGLHPTQIYSSLWEASVFAVLLVLEKRIWGRTSGRIFGIWLIGHGFGRALVEQFRDDFRGPTPFNLSISTWMSFVAIVIGLAVLLRTKKAKA